MFLKSSTSIFTCQTNKSSCKRLVFSNHSYPCPSNGFNVCLFTSLSSTKETRYFPWRPASSRCDCVILNLLIAQGTLKKLIFCNQIYECGKIIITQAYRQHKLPTKFGVYASPLCIFRHWIDNHWHVVYYAHSVSTPLNMLPIIRKFCLA